MRDLRNFLFVNISENSVATGTSTISVVAIISIMDLRHIHDDALDARGSLK